MDNYNLGIMWSIGTLVKGINRYTIQTSDESKLYYMEKLAAEHDKEIKKSIRNVRGKETEIYTLSFSDADCAFNLRNLGYDNAEKSLPDNADDSFMAAFLELNIKPYLNNGYICYRIICSDSAISAIVKLFKKIKIEKEEFDISDIKSTIEIGRNDMLKLSEYMMSLEKSNKNYWKQRYDESVLVGKKKKGV